MKHIKNLLLAAIILLLMEFAGVSSYADAAIPASTDPMRVKQSYLDLIHIDKAWAAAGDSKKSVVVAVVDTGVDLTHPDLVGNFVAGINLINSGAKPLDDNGHGTNVAGVIAASMNNDKGIAGIAPNVKIMPIKALESDGSGGESKLGEGIRYAVDHGADIVVLSLGLNKNPIELAATVQYAEDHNVLLVAAVGNEGNSVKYPAAYPSVLAVGGVTSAKLADERSNFGSEIDLVAPWDVFTTKLGGGYEYKDGTSMSAPQVAGVAALLLSKYPQMTAIQLRSHLLQTTEKLNASGWNPQTGYGFLRADLALTMPVSDDRFEPNDRKEQAAKIPVQSLIHATLSSGKDQDWYTLESPYDGTVDITIRSTDQSNITLRTNSGIAGKEAAYTLGKGNKITLFVKKGTTSLQLQPADLLRKTPAAYSMLSEFHIYRDPFEDNDKQFKAFVLPGRTQTIRGTFHQKDDQDWFQLSLEQSGTMRIKVSVDTARIDPVILFQKKGEKSITIDEVGEGATEITSEMSVLPGEYYIRISNIKDYTNAVTGEYTLSIEFSPKLLDPNEPNDKPYQATYLGWFSDYKGVFHNNEDVDWFEFRIDKESLVQMSFRDIPTSRRLGVALYDSSLKELAAYKNKSGQSSIRVDQKLAAGTYYLKLKPDRFFVNQMYHLQIGVYSLKSGYIDINEHWASDAIVELTSKGWISGYGNFRFAPDRSITRAEAATVLVKALNLTKQRELSYTDLGPKHWSYPYIAKAEQAGLVEGYPDGSFQPDRVLTRMEMVSMLARSMNMKGTQSGNSPFIDVKEDYWGISVLKQMRSEGWINGYKDGSFQPEKHATRAEFVTMLQKVLNR